MRAIPSLLAAAVLLVFASSCQTPGTPVDTPGGITFVNGVDHEPDAEVSLTYRKYRLDNGLTVVLHEDRSDPLVHVDVTYHVGSGR